MITSLDDLAVDGPASLKAPSRVLRLYLHKHLGNVFNSVFGLSGLAFLTVLWIQNPRALSDQPWVIDLFAILIGLWIGAACLSLLIEAKDDSLLLYWRAPERFLFASAEITEEERVSSRIPNGAGHILAKGSFTLPDGGKAVFEEHFAYPAWLGLNPACRLEPEHTLTSGPNREGPGLPIPVSALYQRSSPGKTCLAGISKTLIEQAKGRQPSEALLYAFILGMAFALLFTVMPVYVVSGLHAAAGAALGISALLSVLALGYEALFKPGSLSRMNILIVFAGTWGMIFIAFCIFHPRGLWLMGWGFLIFWLAAFVYGWFLRRAGPGKSGREAVPSPAPRGPRPP